MALFARLYSSLFAKRWRWIGLLVVVLGLVGWHFKHSAGPVDPVEKTATVAAAQLVEVITATGLVVPRTSVQITCKASGMVLAVLVQPSSRVKKGDLLLEIDPQEEGRNRQRAEVALASAQARLEQARLGLAHEVASIAIDRHRAEAAQVSARINAQDAGGRAARRASLLERHLATPEDVETARRDQTSAELALVSAGLALEELDARERLLESRKCDIVLAESAVKDAQLNLGDAEQRLADTRISAPIDGVVTQVNVEAGQLIASAISTIGAGTPVMTVADLGQLQVKVNVAEVDVGRVVLGQKAQVGTEAYPGRRFPGTVQRIAAEGSKADGQQVTSFETIVALEGTDLPLRPHMSAVIDITTLDCPDALTVPVKAILRAKGRTQVKVRTVTGNEERPVILGGSDGVNQQILSGVVAGDTVIIPEANSSRWHDTLVNTGF